ncbi:MAG TPA: hypothetical protein VIX59_04575 [Candidatus Binataceae bacterium]
MMVFRRELKMGARPAIVAVFGLLSRMYTPIGRSTFLRCFCPRLVAEIPRWLRTSSYTRSEMQIFPAGASATIREAMFTPSPSTVFSENNTSPT